MPVETASDFSKAILEEAQQEAEGILDLAKREADRILEDAQQELENIYRNQTPRAATQMARSRYKQLVAAAELDARKQHILLQERLIAEVEHKVKESLLRLRYDATYPALLARLIQEGLAELSGNEFELLVADEDRSLLTDAMLRDISTRTGKTLRLAEPIEPAMSGVIVRQADKRAQYDNSLQAVFRRQEHEMRMLIAQNLFEGLALNV